MKRKTKILGAILAVAMLCALAASVTAASGGGNTNNGCGRPIEKVSEIYLGVCSQVFGITPFCQGMAYICTYSCVPSCTGGSKGFILNCTFGCRIIHGQVTGICL